MRIYVGFWILNIFFVEYGGGAVGVSGICGFFFRLVLDWVSEFVFFFNSVII